MRGHRAVCVRAVNVFERDPRSVERVRADSHQVEVTFVIRAFEHRVIDRELHARSIALDRRDAGQPIVGAVRTAEKEAAGTRLDVAPMQDLPSGHAGWSR